MREHPSSRDKLIPIGVDNFNQLLRENYVFCDKTLLIKEFMNKGDIVTLIARPRRWGKTLNMSMLHHFLAEEAYGKKTKNLFDNLAIASVDDGEYLKHQGQHPVIFVSFKDVKENSFSEAIQKLKLLVRILYREHRVLLKSNKLAQDEKDIFKAYLEGNIGNTEVEDAIRYLSELLSKQHEKGVYIIIDEYDTPLNSAYGKYLEDMTNFMRNMFSAALKGNPALKRGIMTGILRVSKDSMLSGLNNLKTYTLLDDSYKQHFGFSEQEVIDLFRKKHCELKLEDVRTWYNGYKAYDLVIYNPWSIINCLAEQGKIELYWTDSARNNLVEDIISKSTLGIKLQLEILMQNKTITMQVDKHVTFDTLMESETALWSLLLFTGYLKAESSFFDMNSGTYQCVLSVPNREVFVLYQKYIINWFTKKLGEDGSVKYDSFLKSLVNGDVEVFTDSLSDYLLESASVFDMGGEKKGEAFYHGFSLALIVSLRENYSIHSNRESGLGRYDVLLIPKNVHTSKGVVLEFKYAKPNQDVVQVAKDALEQINEKQYITELKNHNNIKSVLKIGIAFSGKLTRSAYETTDLVTGKTDDVQLSKGTAV